MEYPAEPVAASYVKARDLVSRQWYWQWLERAGVGDALVRPVPVVELLELPLICPELSGQRICG
jgi:hypothetical protein